MKMNEAKIQGKTVIIRFGEGHDPVLATMQTKIWTFLSGDAPAKKKHSFLNEAKTQGFFLISHNSVYRSELIALGFRKKWTFFLFIILNEAKIQKKLKKSFDF